MAGDQGSAAMSDGVMGWWHGVLSDRRDLSGDGKKRSEQLQWQFYSNMKFGGRVK